ncbi:MAG TPA: YlaI family protein [Bacillus sp. (in: firmicutes)]|uniref:YlaI family protein n=1 Tax=Bacillus litorisediminis TaxID=2922713 RepID=UPI001FAB8320|nr:YlaI family protein [Bacillus litorisediminis]HWO74844.1 YlaI family protein [Bacillus sp. (in: firmicutes)]
MRVQCFICEKIDTIDDDSPLAKKLRNRPIHTYLCDDCNHRITERTEIRKQSGQFRLYEPKKVEDDWI